MLPSPNQNNSRKKTQLTPQVNSFLAEKIQLKQGTATFNLQPTLVQPGSQNHFHFVGWGGGTGGRPGDRQLPYGAGKAYWSYYWALCRKSLSIPGLKHFYNVTLVPYPICWLPFSSQNQLSNLHRMFAVNKAPTGAVFNFVVKHAVATCISFSLCYRQANQEVNPGLLPSQWRGTHLVT